jgi:hypothetical protein
MIEGERDVECAWHQRFKHLRVRALEDRARRDDASAWAILQGSGELSRVRWHRKTIGVLVHR